MNTTQMREHFHKLAQSTQEKLITEWLTKQDQYTLAALSLDIEEIIETKKAGSIAQ